MKLSNILAREYDPEALNKIRQAFLVVKRYTQAFRNELEYCPCCKAPIADVPTQYPKEIVLEILGMAMAYVRITGKYEFTLPELQKATGRQLSHTAYCNINHFVRFGGIMYRPIDPKTGEPYKSGHFGINMERAREFFQGKRQAPVKVIRNRFTNEKEYTKISVGEFPSIKQFIDEDGNYNPYSI